jgi:hypothetical protein
MVRFQSGRDALTEVPERVAPAPGRSRACADQTHQACGHVIAAIPSARPRREATILLCSCACHEACQLARRKLDGVPVRVWRQRCRCPGAEQARTTQGDPRELLPGFEEFRETFEREAPATLRSAEGCTSSRPRCRTGEDTRRDTRTVRCGTAGAGAEGTSGPSSRSRCRHDQRRAAHRARAALEDGAAHIHR